MGRLVLVAVVVATALTTAGCGNTQIRESHILQAVQPDGEIAYYRVQIRGDANLAKTNFRAGLYDAEALDALLTGASSNDTASVDQTLERNRRVAVSRISAQYYEALGGDSGKVEELQRSLAQAMKSPYLLAQEAAPGGRDSAHPEVCDPLLGHGLGRRGGHRRLRRGEGHGGHAHGRRRRSRAQGLHRDYRGQGGTRRIDRTSEGRRLDEPDRFLSAEGCGGR